MVPLCQDSFAVRVLAVCKSRVRGPFLGPPIFATLWAGSFDFADPGTDGCTPLATTDTTKPTKNQTALRQYLVRSAIICFIVPLSCHLWSPSCQGVVLAHLVAAALRATCAFGPMIDSCFPAVQVAIWALITCPPNLPVGMWLDVNVA